MKRVLFAWELGEGLGHVSPLVAIADALVAAGRKSGTEIEPIFAFCEPVYGREALGDRPWRVLPAPRLTEIQDIQTRGSSYADLLAIFGFARRRELTLSVAAWDDLYAVTGADLVVADHSPTACLAARGRLPLVVTGSGIFLPPADLPSFPPLRADAPGTQNQTTILNTVNALLVERGIPKLDRLPQLLEGDARAVLTLPHLDPYRVFRSEPVLGYHQRILGPLPAPPAEGIFFYSRSTEPNLDEIAQVLGRCGIPVIAYIRGAQSTGASYLAHMGFDVRSRPLPPVEAFQQSTIIISHGGGIAQAAAQAGRRQIILPTHLEPVITGTLLEKLGAGLMVEQFDADALADAVRQVAGDVRFEERAIDLARDIAALGLPESPAGVVADLCLEAISRHGSP